MTGIARPDAGLAVGDEVIKNTANWLPDEFDAWGRGLGVGVVVEPPFPLDPGEVDVRWPAGRCFELSSGLLKYMAEVRA